MNNTEQMRIHETSVASGSTDTKNLPVIELKPNIAENPVKLDKQNTEKTQAQSPETTDKASSPGSAEGQAPKKEAESEQKQGNSEKKDPPEKNREKSPVKDKSNGEDKLKKEDGKGKSDDENKSKKEDKNNESNSEQINFSEVVTGILFSPIATLSGILNFISGPVSYVKQSYAHIQLQIESTYPKEDDESLKNLLKHYKQEKDKDKEDKDKIKSSFSFSRLFSNIFNFPKNLISKIYLYLRSPAKYLSKLTYWLMLEVIKIGFSRKNKIIWQDFFGIYESESELANTIQKANSEGKLFRKMLPQAILLLPFNFVPQFQAIVGILLWIKSMGEKTIR